MRVLSLGCGVQSSTMSRTNLKHFDLFAGIGGFSLGFRWAGGFDTVGFCEIEPYCQKVLAKHWPDVPIYDDVRTLTHDRLRADGLDTVDILTGGFPCQPVSQAGAQRGADDPRWLWPEFARLIGDIRPRWVLAENVPRLLAINDGREFGDVLRDLAQIGYAAEWYCVAAADVGAWHLRERVWLVAYPESERRREEGQYCQRSAEWTAGSSALSDTASVRLERSELQQQRLTISKWAKHYSGWDAEPDVGRVVDGLSLELDFSRQIGTWCEKRDRTQTNTTRNQLVWQMLRAVWENRHLATSSPDVYVRRLCDSVPEVPLRNTQNKWLLGQWFEEESALYHMWESFYAESFEKAQNMQYKLLERAWSAKRAQTVGSRTDRLSGLGNAIVPQIAQMFGEAILIAEFAGAEREIW